MFKKLLINNRDFINKLKSESLDLEVNNADEYSFTFELIPINQEEFNFLVSSQFSEIQLLDENDNVIYGAFLYGFTSSIFSKDSSNIFYDIEISTQSYMENTSRIAAKWEIGPSEPDPDLNALEVAIFNLADKYLSPKGYIVDSSNIQTGLHTKEISSEDTAKLKTFKEVMDFIADKTHSHWYISKEKTFYVDRGIQQYSIHETPFVFIDDASTDISKNRHFLSEEFTIEISNDDYFNKLTVYGARAGNHYVLDENYLDENGDLIYQVENTTEQARLAEINGSDGVIEREETNDKLDTVENIKAYGDQLIAKYGAPRLILNAELMDGSINLNMGDFIYIRHNHKFDHYLDTFKPDLKERENLIFCIDSISDIDYGGAGTTKKALVLSQRDENSVSKSFWDIFKQETDPYETETQKPSLFTNSITLQMSQAIITDVAFNKVEEVEE